VNIALANEFAQAADALGIDVQEVIAAANSQPYSHIHQPGIGVGGHCIPVYPHLLLARAPGLRLVETAREVNDGQSDRA
ncbi:UDP-N-acetyl-D-mannosamine dehydrogenase, partial [Klebsiella pneumoniae]|nr:UDP-N-acetyl-D-mannosamine dehydrogenase [Klebsiella pneumoniae]